MIEVDYIGFRPETLNTLYHPGHCKFNGNKIYTLLLIRTYLKNKYLRIIGVLPLMAVKEVEDIQLLYDIKRNTNAAIIQLGHSLL